MSRNPYLAASRPSSSYTRSSRSSKRNDFGSTSSRTGSSLLGRSRSSASLAAGLSSGYSGSSAYISPASYTPSVPTSSWQRSSSTNRLNSQASDTIATRGDRNSAPLYKSTSSHNLAAYSRGDSKDDESNETNGNSQENEDSNHLQNYQQSKLEQQDAGSRGSSRPSPISPIAGLNNSTTSLDSSGTKLSYDESESIRSGSAPKHLRQGANLMKTQSLDAGQQPLDSSSLLSGTMSVDRLLLRSETMSERELRKSYKDLVMENEKLRRHLKGLDDREKLKQQDWIRKERQLERKISELEEENKQLEQWRIESQRLKDENSSLIRVLSKISKKHN